MMEKGYHFPAFQILSGFFRPDTDYKGSRSFLGRINVLTFALFD